MRVLIVSDTTGYMKGGVPAETVQLIRGLRSRNSEVAFAGDIPLTSGDGVRHFPMTVPTNATLVSQLRNALDAFAPDVVHLISISSRGLLRLLPLLALRPWLMTCHSIPPYERKLGGFHASEALHYRLRSARFIANTVSWRWLLRSGRVPHVVVHSQFVRAIAVRYGVEARDVSLIPLPQGAGAIFPAAPMQSHGPHPLIVTVGGIAHTKGQHDMIIALAELHKEFPGLRYQMIGEVRDESYTAYLRELVASHGLDGSVEFLHGLTHEEKNAALRRADVYVQPSHEEGFCLAYIEAAAVVPRLVGTDTGGIASISADDPAARVVPSKCPGRLAEAVRELLRMTIDPGLMGARAARLATRFALSSYLDAHQSLYAAVALRCDQGAWSAGRIA